MYDDSWHRYHHLFQELLQHRLRSETDPEHLADLHRRAAAWLANASRMHAAVRHLLAAGDEDVAAALVEKHMRLNRVRAPYDARRLIELLPEQILSSSAASDARSRFPGHVPSMIENCLRWYRRSGKRWRSKTCGFRIKPALYANGFS